MNKLKNFKNAVIASAMIIVSFLLLSADSQIKAKKITFKSKDGLKITADLYAPHKNTAPFIVLCHRAGWSRGEYIEIAPKLNAMGFNCMAIDQRAGGSINNYDNETAKEAVKKSLKTDFIEALPDISASVEFARNKYAKGSLILWGSSYSSSLCIVTAAEYQNPKIIDALIAFSPGEYFKNQGKSETYIEENAKSLSLPIFITSKNSESDGVNKIYNAIPSANKVYYIPQVEGKHGSQALWEKSEGNKECRDALNAFLKQFIK